MSEKKGPFDSALGVLREFSGKAWENASARESCEAAICVLTAAGKVDKKMTFMALEDLPLAGFSAQNIIRNQLYSLIKALPDGSRQESRQNGAVKE
jgi:hypothetical protein